MTQRYALIVERADNNWAAYVPDLPRCITTGTTLEDAGGTLARRSIGHLQTLPQLGGLIPPATRLAKEIEVPPAA
jgi:predicted RNase H-like HicB family nuclease